MILEISDRIRVRKLTYFNNVQVHMKYDSISSAFQFDFFFDPDNNEHKELACIGHVHTAKLKEDNETLMTGFVLNNRFNDAPIKTLASVSGRSLTSVLEKCTIPIGTPDSWIAGKGYAKYVINKIWPGTFQSDGLTLREIAQKCINPFNLQMVVDASASSLMDEKYDESTAKETQTIKSYLCELAAQKNIIVTDDEFGRLVFTKLTPNKKPIFHFKDNIPGTTMEHDFNGDDMHSHIRVYQQQDSEADVPASENQVENPYIPFVFRPLNETQNSGDANDTKKAGENIRARELRNDSLTITTDRWKINNKIIRPGNIISVTNPRVYLYKKSDWFIEEVMLKGTPESTVATLKCVLPEVYNGQTPNYIYKGINLH